LSGSTPDNGAFIPHEDHENTVHLFYAIPIKFMQSNEVKNVPGLDSSAASEPKHKALQVFAGKWQTAGRTFGGDFGPAVEISGIDTYEWLAGGYFLIHRVDVNIGRDKVEGIEIIGYDERTQSYPIYAFDNQGNSSRYEAQMEKGQWKFIGESERALVKIDADIIRASWERLSNGSEWLPWMEVTLKRIK
jgi:hypothetical protein